MSLSNKTKKWLKSHAPADMRGKTVIITGANSGVGFKSAETMAYLGAKVIMACRNAEKAERAKTELLNEYPDAQIELMALDLADFSSIEAFVENIKAKQTDIHLFVNNAGVFHQPDKKTADGLELVLGTNYFGTYYLTETLMPYLQTLPHEVQYVNTISIIHKTAKKVDYSNFYYEKKYGNFRVYARSKLCLARYTYALAQACAKSNVRVLMNHPGIAITPLGINAFGSKVGRLAKVFSKLFNSPEKSSLSLALIAARNFEDGSIIGPNALFGGWGYPKRNKVKKKVKVGAEQLLGFTKAEIKKTRAR